MAPLTPLFKEEQKFNQWWFWLLLTLIFLSPFIIKFKSIVELGFWGTFSKGILSHIATLGIVIILFLIHRLKTQIHHDRIEINYFPFFKKTFAIDDLKKIEVITYSFWQVGGWGIRFSRSLGTVFNVRGYDGLSLELQNGKKYVIGTQKAEELKNLISTFTLNSEK